MQADPEANMSFNPDPKKPIGGHILAHASTTRLCFQKEKNSNRVANIWDSPMLLEGEASFAIADGGVVESTD